MTRAPIIAADATGIARAISLLRGGDVVALPTETVYGLAADACQPGAVARIYAAKGRPAFNPLIVHVTDMDMARCLADLPDLACDLAARFWPGPLTLAVPVRADCGLATAVTAGLSTIALRCPDHPVMMAVLQGLGRPLAAPSANRSGRISPTCAAHVAHDLGAHIPLILDGGTCAMGLESTILGVNAQGRVTLLRPGALALEKLGFIPDRADATSIAPGRLASHYAPHLPVRLNARDARADEFHIGFGAIAGDCNLSASADLMEAARCLFDLLHRADASGRSGIAVAPIPETGPGRAINDRLRRAAAPSGGLENPYG